MDLEDHFLPTAFILLTAGISILIAIEIPELYTSLHLGFLHFVATIILIGASMVFMLLDYLLGWGRPYTAPTFPSRAVRTEITENNSNPHKHRCKAHSNEPVVDPPTREQLHKLKEALSLDSGSLQFKKRGQGVYHVCYEQGKHRWRFIGSWLNLKEKLQG